MHQHHHLHATRQVEPHEALVPLPDSRGLMLAYNAKKTNADARHSIDHARVWMADALWFGLYLGVMACATLVAAPFFLHVDQTTMLPILLQALILASAAAALAMRYLTDSAGRAARIAFYVVLAVLAATLAAIILWLTACGRDLRHLLPVAWGLILGVMLIEMASLSHLLIAAASIIDAALHFGHTLSTVRELNMVSMMSGPKMVNGDSSAGPAPPRHRAD